MFNFYDKEYQWQHKIITRTESDVLRTSKSDVLRTSESDVLRILIHHQNTTYDVISGE